VHQRSRACSPTTGFFATRAHHRDCGP
jgi:hypothetical protein